MNARLQFRRQFILTRALISPPIGWVFMKIGEYYLYAHPDLEVTRLTDYQKEIVLIGNIYDSREPEKSNDDILKDIFANVCSIEGLVTGIKRYAGRYVFLYRDGNNAVILPDALALREVYYCTNINDIVCGSQPNLVAKFSNPELKANNDPDFVDFFRSHLRNSKWNPDYKWIGDETYYDSISHLLPNHYLDINGHQAIRFWPNKNITKREFNEAVSESCMFLQGSISAIAHRHSVMMAVTAGTDSRTLLAASRDIKDKIYYFVNNEGHGYDHPDIAVPRKIFQDIGVPFRVHDVLNDVDEEFRQIFLSNTFFASERVLPTIYNVYFKNHSDKVNILGIGEIGRTRFGKEPRNLNSYRMAYKLGYKEGKYVIRKFDQILDEMLPVYRKFGINVMTGLYWEHMLGNWGSVGNSESDIAIEEVNPFNSHLLYEIFLSVDDKYTNYYHPVLFTEMIKKMWPELLNWPINPPGRTRDKLASLLKKVGIYVLLKEFKYQINYARYLYKYKARSL